MGKITLRWLEGTLMMANDSNGHSIVIGRSPDKEFDWLGMKPSELLLISAASCSAYDVATILGKQKEPLRDMLVECIGEQMSEPPYRYTDIHLHYILLGDVDFSNADKAVKLSQEKYCSVTNSLHPEINLTYEIEIKP